MLLAERELERRHLRPERLHELLQGAFEGRALAVELVDHDRARQGLHGQLPGDLRLDLDAVHGRDDEHDRVDGSDRCADVADEVGVAGRVEDVDLHAVPFDRCHPERDADALLDLLRLEVAHRVAVFDGPHPRRGAGGEEHRLEQRGLPRAAVPHQQDVADVVRFVRFQMAPDRRMETDRDSSAVVALAGAPTTSDTLARVVEVSVRAQLGERAVVPLLCVAAGWRSASRPGSCWSAIEPAGWAALAAGAASSPAGSSCVRTIVSAGWSCRSATGCSTGACWERSPGSLGPTIPGSRPGVARARLRVPRLLHPRAGGPGYGIEEGHHAGDPLRPGLGGLIAGWRWTPWAVAVLMLLASAVRASQVVKEERL